MEWRHVSVYKTKYIDVIFDLTHESIAKRKNKIKFLLDRKQKLLFLYKKEVNNSIRTESFD